MKTIFRCKECGILLSNNLDGPVKEIHKNYTDGKDHVLKENYKHFRYNEILQRISRTLLN